MTVYILLIFVSFPNGAVVAEAKPTMFLGADLCLAQVEPTKEAYKSMGITEDRMRITCVDSTFVPGVAL